MTASRNFLNAIMREKEKKTASADELRSRLSFFPGKAPSFATLPGLKQLRLLEAAAKKFNLPNPFFKVHEGSGGAHSIINKRDYINFSHYNYLGLNSHPEVNAAAVEAIARYGTSAGASRLVAGERPPQQALETALAELYGVESAIVFVSGHATNVSVISTIFDSGDLILHDSLIHNSVIEGSRSSGALRRAFPHNDFDALEVLLKELRSGRNQALIVVEGLYSMDGDSPNLERLIELKKRYKAFLMVDEAHSLGVLGKSGRGLAEAAAIDPNEVDIWMGTLSKTLASCGGYIAGSRDLTDFLKASAAAFVYSVGISPCLAAASCKALEIMRREPERVEKLRTNSSLFFQRVKAAGFNTGSASGNAIIPIIIGSSRKALEISGKLFEEGINVQPIIHPAVEEKASRLRFFLSSEHTEDDIFSATETMQKLFSKEGLLL